MRSVGGGTRKTSQGVLGASGTDKKWEMPASGVANFKKSTPLLDTTLASENNCVSDSTKVFVQQLRCAVKPAPGAAPVSSSSC